MQLDSSLDAELEKLRRTIASGDRPSQRYVMRGSMFAGFLWTDLHLKDLLDDRIPWRRFQRIYRNHSYLFMNWLHGKTAFIDALENLLQTCNEVSARKVD